MKKKEYGFMFSFMTIVIILTAKFWVKQRFELQALEFALLFVVSWVLKFFLFKKVFKKKKDDPKKEEENDSQFSLEKEDNKPEDNKPEDNKPEDNVENKTEN